MNNGNPNIQVLKASETGIFTNYIYKAIPLAFDESMSYYECLCGLLSYLKDTVIPTVNNNADAVIELQQLYEELKEYVDNYFENLDVQEEINNKLDEMARTGVLTNLIGSYINPYIDEQNERLDQQDIDINNQNREIESFEAQINQALQTTTDYFDSKLNDLTSATPLVASSTSEMSDTSRIYVNTSDGKWYYYDDDNDQWTIGGTYQETGIPEHFIIEPSFKSTKRVSRNLFDKQHVYSGYIGSDGVIHEDGTSASGLNVYTDFIPVDSSVSNYVHYQGKCNLIFYDNTQTYISGTSALTDNSYYTLPEGASYIRLSTLLSLLDTYQLEYGKRYSGYDGYKYVVNELVTDKDLLFKNNQLAPQNIEGFRVLNDNLFNPYDIVDGTVTTGDGWVQDTSSFSNPKSSNFIEIEPSETYYCGTAWKNVIFYDEDKLFISGSSLGDATVSSPATAKYLRIAFSNDNIKKVCCIKSTTKNMINFEYTLDNLQQTVTQESSLYSPFKKDYIDYKDLLNGMTSNSRIVQSQDEFNNTCIGINPNNDNNTGGAIVLNYFIETSKKCCEIEFDSKGKYGTNNFIRVVYYDSNNTEINISQNARELILSNYEWKHKKLRFIIPMFAKVVKIMIFSRPGSALFIKNMSINCIDRALVTNNSNLKFIAHQGQPLFAPENTIPSFEYAIKGGYDSCVINVNWTSDNVIVCLHDDTIDRTSDGTGNIHEMSYETALNYDFGSWFNTCYEGTKLPTLDEVLKLFSRNGVKPTIRWNNGLSSDNRDKIFAMLDKYGLVDNVTIIGFDIDTLIALKQLKPNYKYGYSGYDTLNTTLINKLKQLGDDVYLDREFASLTQTEVNTCHANGIKVSTWVINDRVHLYEKIGWGVDAIKTDVFCLQNCDI